MIHTLKQRYPTMTFEVFVGYAIIADVLQSNLSTDCILYADPSADYHSYCEGGCRNVGDPSAVLCGTSGGLHCGRHPGRKGYEILLACPGSCGSAVLAVFHLYLRNRFSDRLLRSIPCNQHDCYADHLGSDKESK